MRRIARAISTPAVLIILLTVGRAVAQPEGKADDYQPAEDEKLLKAADVGVDGPGLLAFFRKLVPTPTDEKRIDALLAQLGDKTFRVREKAVVDLIAVGPPALPGLRRVAKDADLETSRRALRCLEAIERRVSPEAVAAAARLLKVRRAEGACAVLLAYLPSAADSAVEEVVEGLFVLGVRDGKLDPAVSAALKDAAPARVAAAALVVGRFGTREQRQAVVKLLADDNPTVRLRAAQGLVCGRESAAVPALIALLGKGPLPVAEQAEELLARVAGEGAPAVQFGDGKERDKAREAWAKWWEANKEKVDLKKQELASPFAGPAVRARGVTRQFLEALIKGDLDTVRRTIDVPFAIDAFLVLKTRAEADNIFQQAAANVKKEKQTFRITQVLTMDDYVKRAPRVPTEFLKQVAKDNLRAVLVDGTQANGKQERAAVLVRFQGGRVRVVGIGQVDQKK